MRPPGGRGGRALSDPELFRLERYNVMRSQLQEIDPENPELRKEYLTGPEGFVPTEADVDALYQALKDARSGRSPPQGPVNTPDNPRGPERSVTPNVPLRNNEGLVPPDKRQEPRSVEPRPRGVIDESEAGSNRKSVGVRNCSGMKADTLKPVRLHQTRGQPTQLWTVAELSSKRLIQELQMVQS